MSRDANQRFQKSERLLKRSDFLRVQRRGSRFKTSRLVVLHLPSAVERRRVGFTVSTRVGNAVVRNLIKRRLRAAYRLHKADWPDDIDVVVIARTDAHGASFEQLADDLAVWARRLAEHADTGNA